MVIKRKTVTLFLGLAIATACTPLVQCAQTNATSKIIKGSLLLAGAYTGYQSLKNLRTLINTLVYSDDYDAIVSQTIDQNPETQNTPFTRLTRSWGTRIYIGTSACIYGLLSYIMIKNSL